MPLLDLDITTGKGIVLVLAMLAALIAAWAASTAWAIAILVGAILIVAYIAYALGVRINRRVMGRGRKGGKY